MLHEDKDGGAHSETQQDKGKFKETTQEKLPQHMLCGDRSMFRGTRQTNRQKMQRHVQIQHNKLANKQTEDAGVCSEATTQARKQTDRRSRGVFRDTTSDNN